ncbi:MAG TPA: hypothetical protein GX498_07360 [Clostridiales bacterium]|nr:hypothetical protein [Clostridiales bacterium]
MDNFFDKKITARVLSVLLATMLWLYVITEQNPVVYKDITLPVRIIGVETLAANNITIIDNASYNVSLRLKGNKNTLDRISNTSLNASADIRGQREKGEFYVPIQISGLPAGVDIISMSPNSVKLNFDNVVSIAMPVSINITGNPLQGMAAMTPSINPGEVTIKGAESIVNKVKKALVDYDISSSSETIRKNMTVKLLDEAGKTIEGLEVSPKAVDVTIPIEYTKIVEIEPDVVVNPAPGYIITNISTNPKEIHIVGNKDLLDKLDSIKTERIEIRDAKAFVEQQVSLMLPEGIELANKKETVRLRINVEKIIEKPLEVTNISVRNLSDNLTAEFMPVKVQVTARGPETIVNAWDVNNSFYVDAANLGQGIHMLEIKYEKPAEIEILMLEPKFANVVLKDKGEVNSDVSRGE